VVVVTDVYPAREEPIQGISGELIVHAAKQYGHKAAHYVPLKTDVPKFVSGLARSGDLIITMGAGDIWKYGLGILAGLQGPRAGLQNVRVASAGKTVKTGKAARGARGRK
jgi:UDP-N-acetylmuramate--alanine ligase